MGGEKQIMIYFVRRVLQGHEIGHFDMEKLALLLLNVAIRLRRYFLAQQIEVLTNALSRQVLLKVEKSGPLATSVVEF